MMQKEEWYQTWFDTHYYHILYRHRDIFEAQEHINALLHFLKLPQSAYILDLACGSGRHAQHIASKGFSVVGYDLSPNNIKMAKQFENDSLNFEVRDMLTTLGEAKFDAVFNLFTSFGYFPTREAHFKALENVYTALKPKGLFILDFLNVQKIKNQLVPREIKEIEGITFYIERHWENGFINKTITVADNGNKYHYQEKVMGFTAADFMLFFQSLGFEIRHQFGDFSLSPFDEETSDRLIFVVEK